MLQRNVCDILLSNYATVSNKAFAILIFENNFDTWLDMGKKGIRSNSDVPRRYTNGGSSTCKVASSQHNKGWSDKGLIRFNELFDLVEKNRAEPYAKEFEENFRKYCKDKASVNKKKKIQDLYREVVQIRHELWGDTEDKIISPDTNNESVQKTNKSDNSIDLDCNDKEEGGSDIEDESETEGALPEEDEPVLD